MSDEVNPCGRAHLNSHGYHRLASYPMQEHHLAWNGNEDDQGVIAAASGASCLLSGRVSFVVVFWWLSVNGQGLLPLVSWR
jgi:hypothetical protein